MSDMKFKLKSLSSFFICTLGLVVCGSLYALSTQQQKRQLASLPQLVGVNTEIKNQTPLRVKSELNFNCNNSNMETVSAKSEMVMLKFSKCENFNPEKIAAIEVRNITNGYQGKVFKSGTKNLVSEYLQLRPGENLVRLQIRLNGGQTSQKLIKINQIIN